MLSSEFYVSYNFIQGPSVRSPKIWAVNLPREIDPWWPMEFTSSAETQATQRWHARTGHSELVHTVQLHIWWNTFTLRCQNNGKVLPSTNSSAHPSSSDFGKAAQQATLWQLSQVDTCATQHMLPTKEWSKQWRQRHGDTTAPLELSRLWTESTGNIQWKCFVKWCTK